TFVVTLVTFVVFSVLPKHFTNGRRNERGTATLTPFDARGTVPVAYLSFLGPAAPRPARVASLPPCGPAARPAAVATPVIPADPATPGIARGLRVTASLVI